jgi:hypothetical protein
VLVEREIFVADVAAAGDGQFVVGHEQLVVHAMVDSRNIRDRGEDAAPDGGPTAGKGIEDPHLDVGVMAEMQEAPVLAGRIEVIHQHPHAYPPVRSLAHVLEQGARGFVLMDDVVLDVERAFGVVGERDQAVERLFAGRQQSDARQVPVAAVLARADDAGERAALRRLQGDARIFLDVQRQARATREDQDRAGQPGFAHQTNDIRQTSPPCMHTAAFEASFCAPGG